MKINNKIKTVVMASAAILLLAGCTTNANKETKSNDPKTEQNKAISQVGKYNNVKNSTFLVKDGKVVKNDGSIKDEDIIDWYIDPYCPSCTKLEGIMEPKLDEISSKMTIRYHTMNFLSPQSADDYSTRASAFLLGAAEKAPEVAMEFFKKVVNDDFRPHAPREGEDKSVARKTDDQIKELFFSVKGTEEQWTEILGIKEGLMSMVRQSTSEAFNSKELAEKAPGGRLSVPLVVVGKSNKAIDFTEALDAESHFLDTVNKYVEENKKSEDTKRSEEKTTDSATTEKPEESKTEATSAE